MNSKIKLLAVGLLLTAINGFAVDASPRPGGFGYTGAWFDWFLTGSETFYNKTFSDVILSGTVTFTPTAMRTVSDGDSVWMSGIDLYPIYAAVDGTQLFKVDSLGNGTVHLSLTIPGTTSGGIKIQPIATGTATATIQNQNVAASTITLPSATCTLPGLGLSNTWTVAQAFSGNNTHTGTDEWDGSVNGGIKIAPIPTGTAVATIQNQNQAASVITLPVQTCTLPGLSLANTWTASQTLSNSSYIEWDGTTSGGIKIQPLAVGTALTTINNQNVAAATITLPSATCTLPGLGLINTWTALNTVDSIVTTKGAVIAGIARMGVRAGNFQSSTNMSWWSALGDTLFIRVAGNAFYIKATDYSGTH